MVCQEGMLSLEMGTTHHIYLNDNNCIAHGTLLSIWAADAGWESGDTGYTYAWSVPSLFNCHLEPFHLHWLSLKYKIKSLKKENKKDF